MTRKSKPGMTVRSKPGMTGRTDLRAAIVHRIVRNCVIFDCKIATVMHYE